MNRDYSRVAVIIPARNEARNVEAAVMNALSQTYEPLDVWGLDDASEDETLLLIGRLKECFPRLNCLHGSTATRVVGKTPCL